MKRRLLAKATVVSALSLIGFSATGQQKDAFTIGGVVPLSGAYALLGTSMQKGLDLAVEMRGAKALRSPAPRALGGQRDQAADVGPEGQQAARRAARTCCSATVHPARRMAIMPVAAQRKVPLLVTTSAADGITGASRNRYTFRTSNLAYHGDADGGGLRQEGGAEEGLRGRRSTSPSGATPGRR